MEHDYNIATEVLSKRGSSWAEVPGGVFVNELSKPSIEESASSNNSGAIPEVMVIDVPWTQPFIDYILHQELLEEKEKAEQVYQRSKLHRDRQ